LTKREPGSLRLYKDGLKNVSTLGEHYRESARLMLCAGIKRETVELLEIEKSHIRVAEYLPELPPREVLVGKLHEVLEQARQGSDSPIQI
jgi:hypothetical protein